jgi:hypothetical protein
VKSLWLAAVMLSVASEAPALEGLSDVNVEWLKSRAEKERWGRDPFGLGGTKKADKTALTLTAILYNDGNGSVIINNQILKVGDEIAGQRVVQILPDRVQLRGADGVTDLKVQQFLLQK